jgi:hypothetical protein
MSNKKKDFFLYLGYIGKLATSNKYESESTKTVDR